MVILFGIVSIVFTALWLGIYEFLNKAIWSNGFVTSNPWTIPVGVLFFSLLVGLAQKYLRAPTVINGGAAESMKGGGKEPDYTTFPDALLSSYFSLFSGASVGPEGPLGILVQDIATWMGEKLKVAREHRVGLTVASMASAYNGIIGSPLFTAVLPTEFQVGGKELGFAFLAWNLLAGVIGYLFFTLLKLPVFAHSLPFQPISTLTFPDVNGLIVPFVTLEGVALALAAWMAFTEKNSALCMNAHMMVTIVTREMMMLTLERVEKGIDWPHFQKDMMQVWKIKGGRGREMWL
jgi:H+/Cl- antiporter ClcA